MIDRLSSFLGHRKVASVQQPQLSKMTDVFTTVKPMLMVSRVIGLGPFSIDDEKKAIKLSIPGIILSAFALIAFSATAAYGIYEQVMSKKKAEEAGAKEEESQIMTVNEIIQKASGIGVTTCCILLVMIQRNKFITVVQSFYNVAAELLKLEIVIPYQTMFRYTQVELVVLVLLIIGLLLHDILTWTHLGIYKSPDNWIVYFVPNIYNFIMEFQFVSGALLLKKHFSLLNDFLIKFNEVEKPEDEDTKKVDVGVNNNGWMDNFESHMGPKIMDQSFTAWDGNFSRFRVRKVAATDGSASLTQASLAKIKIFRKIHSSLCEIKEALNSAFSLQLLASVAQAFVIITSNLYLLFTNLSKPEKDPKNSLTYPIIWSLAHVIELVVIVVTCTKTSKHANQTAVVVHKLLAKDCEPDIRNQLKLFSIQLLHRKISFTACGFFTLDMTLLQAIIGAATTYLVILIQFHNTYDTN